MQTVSIPVDTKKKYIIKTDNKLMSIFKRGLNIMR